MSDSIRDLMEGWSRYRRNHSNGGYGKTILQRVLEGMPGTGCPTCAGKGRAAGALIGRKGTFIPCPTCGGTGRVKLDATDHQVRTRRCEHCLHPYERESRGEINGRTCIYCRGTGLIVRETDKVNPAFITSTYCESDHPTYQRIDRLVCEFRQRDVLLGYYFVIYYEYIDSCGGNQRMKAGRIVTERRLPISDGNYRLRLLRALKWIEAALHDDRDCRAIPFPYRPAGREEHNMKQTK